MELKTMTNGSPQLQVIKHRAWSTKKWYRLYFHPNVARYLNSVCLDQDGEQTQVVASSVMCYSRLMCRWFEAFVTLPQRWQIWSDTQVVSNSECNSAYNEVITSNMLCAGDASGNGGSDACQVKMFVDWTSGTAGRGLTTTVTLMMTIWFLQLLMQTSLLMLLLMFSHLDSDVKCSRETLVVRWSPVAEMGTVGQLQEWTTKSLVTSASLKHKSILQWCVKEGLAK